MIFDGIVHQHSFLKNKPMANQFGDNQFTFKAWIEKIVPDGTLKLHVHGEVHVEDETLLYQLDKKEPQGYFKEELFLVIKPDPTPGNSKVTIKYHENLANTNTYKKITILTRTEQAFETSDIPVK